MHGAELKLKNIKIMTLEIAVFLAIPFIVIVIFSGICDLITGRMNKVKTTKKASNEFKK
jgi:hypothetical protein